MKQQIETKLRGYSWPHSYRGIQGWFQWSRLSYEVHTTREVATIRRVLFKEMRYLDIATVQHFPVPSCNAFSHILLYHYLESAAGTDHGLLSAIVPTLVSLQSHMFLTFLWVVWLFCAGPCKLNQLLLGRTHAVRVHSVCDLPIGAFCLHTETLILEPSIHIPLTAMVGRLRMHAQNHSPTLEIIQTQWQGCRKCLCHWKGVHLTRVASRHTHKKTEVIRRHIDATACIH